MKKLTITLSEDEYDFVKDKPRGWTRRVVRAFMDRQALVIGRTEGLADPPIRPWWKFWA